MRRTLLLLAPALFLGLLWMERNQSQSMHAQTTGGAPENRQVSFRIVFGELQESPEDYSGSVSLSAGKVVGLWPWRFFGQDALDGNRGWKLQIKRIAFENQPDMPRQMGVAGPTLNLVPAGVVVTVEAPPGATVRIETAQGNFDFRLQELAYDHALSFRDGDVVVERAPTPERISPAAQGPASQEHDYPSVTVTRKGVVWLSWQAYQDLGDHVYARYSTSSGWSEPFRLTDQKGDVFGTQTGEDAHGQIWVVWSERSNEDWDLCARTFDGQKWTARRKLTSARHPNFFHRLVTDPAGTLHLIWIAYQDGQSHVMWSKLDKDSANWSPALEVSNANAWMPDAAVDSKSNLYVAWDSYRTGNYDIFLRKITADGTMDPIQQVTHSAKFQAHASLAVDRQDRVWLAWDESGDNWGKDWNRDDQWRATTLYFDRRPRVAVLEGGQWKQPAADLLAAVPRRYNRFIENPRLACDSSGRIWAAMQIRTATGMNRADRWANNGRWEHFLTSFEGDHWAPLAPVPKSSSRPDGSFAIARAPEGIWMAWVNNNRSFGPAGGFQNPIESRAVHEVNAAPVASVAAVREPVLAAFSDPSGGAQPVHPHEATDVERMRTYRTTVGGTSYRILRGDFHRHTEISQDGAGDGSVEDYFRYMLDAAAMDTGIISDHNAGGDNEYTWWRTEKAIDLYHIKDYYTPLFGYERSVNYPNGHRNVVFAERGTRTLRISREENQGSVNSGPILYPYLKQHRGICMLHSLATDQGSDYRDNDPEVEPLVELYQGYHANYEYEGAPRAEADTYQAVVHGPYRPQGYFWNALAKGHKLGVQASSDHISTHSSYTMIYAPSMERSDIVESMRKRRTYGATDNIIMDFKAVDAEGRAHFMGESFEAATAPKLQVKVIGTAKLLKVEIVKNGKFILAREPDTNAAEFTFVDNAPEAGQSWYYVRAIQVDRNLAWSSPIWVKYANR